MKKLRSDPLRIKKVIAIEGIEDFVYIEADKEQDVQNVSNNYFINCSQPLKLTFIKNCNSLHNNTGCYEV